jgi:hypothetical protein
LELLQAKFQSRIASIRYKKLLEKRLAIEMIAFMAQTENLAPAAVPLEQMQREWDGLKSKLVQLETEQSALEMEIKALRRLLESSIDHRQKSHGELVIVLTNLVSKLPLNDVGIIIARLMEHNARTAEFLSALLKGKPGEMPPAPPALKVFEETKHNLLAAVKQAAEELIHLDTPLETEMLQSLFKQPELFFSPKMARANRCFNKGQLPRERVAKEFGEGALIFFNDLTTDPKLNPHPKPEEIVLGFKYDFDDLFKKNPNAIPDKRQELQALHQKVQRSKGTKEPARSQKIVFAKLSFAAELLHYYENQNTELPEGVFAQRLPVLIEQCVVPGNQDDLDEKLILQAEELLAFVISPDHRQMVVNNIGKSGGTAKTLKFVIKFRTEKVAAAEELMTEFVKHLVPSMPPSLASVLRLVKPDAQRAFVRAVRSSDKMRKDDAEILSKALAAELKLADLEEEIRKLTTLSPEAERQIAWEGIKDFIAQRAEPAIIAAAIRDRLHAKYDADELKQSWLILVEADVMTFIRTFCQLPYLPDGSTDPIAQTLMQTYVTRLTHEKYAAVYQKVVNSLKNMFKANSASPTLVNFLTLVKWVDAEASKKLSADIGMAEAPLAK